jgi:hypothetical protein
MIKNIFAFFRQQRNEICRPRYEPYVVFFIISKLFLKLLNAFELPGYSIEC